VDGWEGLQSVGGCGGGGGGGTFHVEALQNKKLVVTRFVEECAEPGLVPNSAVRLPVLQPLVPGYNLYPWQLAQLRHHLPRHKFDRIR
jgi:hypothetical protein